MRTWYLAAAASDIRPIFAKRRPPVVRGASLSFAVLLFLPSAAPANALPWEWDETKPSLRLTLGVDFFRVPGTTVVSARYGGNWNVKVSTWVHDAGVDPHAPKLLAGAGYVLTKRHWRFGAGLAWIDETNNNVNGTHWNFDGSVAYDVSERVFVEYQHYSHGAILGISSDTSNGGWNLFNLGVIF